ncbi:hypothetical protein NORO109296_04810 [Nocardiopsis rhodophaea]
MPALNVGICVSGTDGRSVRGLPWAQQNAIAVDLWLNASGHTAGRDHRFYKIWHAPIITLVARTRSMRFSSARVRSEP